ncbi:LacI family DNA-binding transcriptional regulator [Microcella daejeonensis]|uniref:LacI family DNA-binding transcriptional regulator n=1 Tax=Microcella daejeonensis TaxID=2994971 RepID=UPI002D1E3CEB|nr:LacI family DNA-binding transcriptional regulator [Microcella daejeonensis]
MSGEPAGPGDGRPAPASRPARASIYDVARLAGVSHQTVSRVINDHPNIRATTRARVEAAMAELRFTRNSFARALATNESRRIGVLIDSPVQYGPTSTLRGLEEAARGRGYHVSVTTVADDPDFSVDAALGQLMLQGIDGLCVIAPRASALAAVRGIVDRCPTLVITAEADAGLLTSAVDQYGGAVAAVEHLIGLGHREIRHLAGPADWLDAAARERGWRDALTRAGLPIHEPARGDWSSDSGYRAATEPGDPAALAGATAVFAANDQMALGLVHGLVERGIRVPDDLSVIGFDDVPDAHHFLPPLTTVRQDFRALGADSLGALLDALAGDPEATGHRVIAAQLVVRASTAPPPAAP